MGKRNNVDEFGYEVQGRRGSGGGRVWGVLIMLGVGVVGVLALVGRLGHYVPATAEAGAELNVGAWAVAAVLAVFFGWCFFSGSKGGR